MFKVCLSMFQIFAILSHGILGAKAPLGLLEVKVKVEVKVKPPKTCGIVRRLLKKCENKFVIWSQISHLELSIG